MTGAFGDVPDRDMAPGDVDLDRVWLGVATAVWQRRPGSLERLAGWLLRSPGLARALLITPSLLLPWLLASAAVLAAGAAATLGTGEPLVTLLAPGVAAAGIAYACGPGIDPAWELSHSMAVSDRMVLLARALGVFAIDAALGIAATLARSANVGVAAGLAGWAITVLAGRAATGRFTAAVSDSLLVLPYLAFAACCAAIAWYATRNPKGIS